MDKESAALTLRLRNAILESERSMTDIARSAGVSRRWLYQFKDGETDNPTLGHAVALAEELGMKLSLCPMSASRRSSRKTTTA